MNTSTAQNTNFLEPTLRRAAAVWWALLWRGILIASGAGFVVGFIEGFIGGAIGLGQATILRLTLVSGLLVGIPAGIYVVQLVLRKHFGEFAIRLVPIPSNVLSSQETA